MASRLGDVIFTINEGETINKSNIVTDYPVEDGVNISDNSDPNPVSISFFGIIQGNDSEEKLNLLRQYSDNGEMLTYTGRNTFSNMVIESFDTTHDNTIKNGFIYSISLKQITVTSTAILLIDFTKVPRPKIKVTETQSTQQTSIQPDPQRFDEIQQRINEIYAMPGVN